MGQLATLEWCFVNRLLKTSTFDDEEEARAAAAATAPSASAAAGARAAPPLDRSGANSGELLLRGRQSAAVSTNPGEPLEGRRSEHTGWIPTGAVVSTIPEAPEGSRVFELLDGAVCHRQLGVLDWALSRGFALGPRLLQRLITDRFEARPGEPAACKCSPRRPDREPGEPDEEETRLHASAHHGALTSPQVSSMRRSTRGTRRTVWHCMRALQQTPSLWSPEEQPLSPLHVKPWSAHRHSRRGGCTPNRRVYRGECSLSQASLIAAQSSVSKSRGESLRRLFEHHRLALCCIYPASSITRDRHPWCLSS